ncbi:MAG: hypothetical protein RJA59_879 [Pseudomonadota bacterium]
MAGRRTPSRPASPAPSSPTSPELATLRAQGLKLKGARLVHGTVLRPGTAVPVPHSWIEADDRVHDPTLGEGRRVWPRELYYLVFRATPTPAAPTRAA